MSGPQEVALGQASLLAYKVSHPEDVPAPWSVMLAGAGDEDALEEEDGSSDACGELVDREGIHAADIEAGVPFCDHKELLGNHEKKEDHPSSHSNEVVGLALVLLVAVDAHRKTNNHEEEGH